MTLKVVTYHALEAGPKLLILGAVHGNEKCGTKALNRLITLLDDGTLTLAKGQLTVIPICNPRAYEKDVRFIERNLNRHLYPKSHPVNYEDFLDPILCTHLGQADYLLDLHSYASLGGPFIFLGGQDSAETNFGRALGIQYFIQGWQNAYQNTNNRQESFNQHLESMGTTEYARAKGAKAVTLECGHHHNAAAPRIGLVAAIKALDGLSMLEIDPTLETIPGFAPEDPDPIYVKSTLAPNRPSASQICIQMCKVYYKTQEGSFNKTWKHLDTVEKGEPLATFQDGSALLADRKGFMILPKESSDVGAEWSYLGEQLDFPCSNTS